MVLCQVDPATGLFSGCGNADGDGSAVFIGTVATALNGTQLYVSTFGDIFIGGSGYIYQCTIANTGLLVQCEQTATQPNGTLYPFTVPAAITLNASKTRAYIGSGLDNNVVLCTVNSINAKLENCINALADGQLSIFNNPVQLVLDASGTRAYVSNNGQAMGQTVSLCAVNLFTGLLSNCQDSAPLFMGPTGIALNTQNTLLYVNNYGAGNTSVCTINPSNGLLISCDTTGSFPAPAGLVLN